MADQRTFVDGVATQLASGTGRPTFVTVVTGSPAAPWLVVHERPAPMPADRVMSSTIVAAHRVVLLQIDSVGWSAKDTMALADRAAREMDTLSVTGAADVLAELDTSPFVVDTDGTLHAVAQLWRVRWTPE